MQVKVRDAIDPNEMVIELYDDDGILEDATRLTHQEARQLTNALYDYYDGKDREAMARYLTKRKG